MVVEAWLVAVLYMVKEVFYLYVVHSVPVEVLVTDVK